MSTLVQTTTSQRMNSFGLFSKPDILFSEKIATKIARGLVSELVGGAEDVQSPLNVELINALKNKIPNFERVLGTLLNLFVANTMKAPQVVYEIAKQFAQVLPTILEVVNNFAEQYATNADAKVRNSVISTDRTTTKNGEIIKGLVPRVKGYFGEILESFANLAPKMKMPEEIENLTQEIRSQSETRSQIPKMSR